MFAHVNVRLSGGRRRGVDLRASEGAPFAAVRVEMLNRRLLLATDGAYVAVCRRHTRHKDINRDAYFIYKLVKEAESSFSMAETVIKKNYMWPDEKNKTIT